MSFYCVASIDSAGRPVAWHSCSSNYQRAAAHMAHLLDAGMVGLELVERASKPRGVGEPPKAQPRTQGSLFGGDDPGSAQGKLFGNPDDGETVAIYDDDGETCDPRLQSLFEDDVVIYDEGDPRAYIENPPRQRRWEDTATARRALEDAIAGACKLYGPGVRNKIESLHSLPVVYNGRLKRAMMRCCFVYHRITHEVEITKIDVATDIDWSSAPDLAYDTLVHEYCHAIRGRLSEDFVMEDDHGREWKRLMVACGAEPNAKCSDPRVKEMRARPDIVFRSESVTPLEMIRGMIDPRPTVDAARKQVVLEGGLSKRGVQSVIAYLNRYGWLANQESEFEFNVVPIGAGTWREPSSRRPSPPPPRPAPPPGIGTWREPSSPPRRPSPPPPPPPPPPASRPPSWQSLLPADAAASMSTEELALLLGQLTDQIEHAKRGDATIEKRWDIVMAELQKRGWK